MIGPMSKRNPAAPGETLGDATIVVDVPTYREWRRLVRLDGDSASVAVREFIRADLKRRRAAARV